MAKKKLLATKKIKEGASSVVKKIIGRPPAKIGAKQAAGFERKKAEREGLFEEVSSQISPLPEEAAAEKQFALKVISQLEQALGGHGVKVFFVGSAARDTGLRGDKDIDLFVSFPQKFSRDEIVGKTIEATRSTIPGSWEMHYAEHPYLQAKLGEFSVEVIPCFQMDAHGQLKSAVDRSPLHMDYLQKRLSLKQKRDVRLLKQLLKRAGIYGAEARIGGFSGLVCEYLVLNYRSLAGLLESASGWKPPVVVDFEGVRRGEDLAKLFAAPLVIVDAIDRKRNAAAAVSLHNLSAFISLSQAFLEKHSRDFFFAPPAHLKPAEKILSLAKQRSTFLCLVEFPAPKVVEDILFPQLRKTLNSIASALERERFQLIDSADFEAGGKLYFLFEFASQERAGVRVFQGPPAWNRAQVLKFASAHPQKLRGPFIRGEKTFVEEKEELMDGREFLEKLLRARDAKVAVGSKIEGALRRAKIFSGKEVVDLQPAALMELQKYLEKKEFWL